MYVCMYVCIPICSFFHFISSSSFSLKSSGGGVGVVGVGGAKHHRKRTRHSQPPQTGISNLLNTSQQHIAQTNHQNHSNELKPTPNAGVRADNLAIHFQQTLISTPNDAQSNGDSLQTDRCTGAKRRKSSSVKRFKKEDSAVDTKNATDISIGKLEPGWTETAGYMGNNGHQNIADAKTGCNIVKIIKPIGYSASLSCYMQDVSVTFMALRLVTQTNNSTIYCYTLTSFIVIFFIILFVFYNYNCVCLTLKLFSLFLEMHHISSEHFIFSLSQWLTLKSLSLYP
jgi:hypothetical protein